MSDKTMTDTLCNQISVGRGRKGYVWLHTWEPDGRPSASLRLTPAMVETLKSMLDGKAPA